MALRVRQRFTLFPGVRVNVGLRGVSATMGVPGASLNLSRRGLRGTVGLPGTGVSYSTNLTPGAARRRSSPPRPQRAAVAEDADPPEEEWHPTAPPVYQPPPLAAIESGPIERMTSPGLQELRDVLTEARRQRTRVAGIRHQQTLQRGRYEAELEKRRRSLLRLFYRRRIRELEDDLLPRTAAELDELEAWHEASRVDLAIDASDAALAAWDDAVRAFRDLMGCGAVWDITAEGATDRARMRTTAARQLDRKPVRFAFGTAEFIGYDGQALNLGNANGEDLLLFPGMAVLVRADGMLALVDAREITVAFTPVGFIETEAVPHDAEVVEHTWLKANKDGSADRRFAGNRQLPVCRYGQLEIASGTGIRETWLVSRTDPARAFAMAFAAHAAALPAG